MQILSWNIQCGKSVHGVIDLDKVVQHINRLGQFDIICLQEIARNLDEHCSPQYPDQLNILEIAFSEYFPIWGAGFSWPSVISDRGARREFGNLTLIKPQLLDFRIHQLPKPAVRDKRQMQRIAIETIINSSVGYLSLINVHLAFHDDAENRMQIEHINTLEKERLAHIIYPSENAPGCYEQNYLPTARIVCGDCNFDVTSNQYQYQLDNNWRDAWVHSYGSARHAPTCGLYDNLQWPQGPHCRDFFWLSHELVEQSILMTVDQTCDLSDHQPVMLSLDI